MEPTAQAARWTRPPIAGAAEAATKAAVSNGKGKMPKVASVTGADLDNVASFVASLKK